MTTTSPAQSPQARTTASATSDGVRNRMTRPPEPQIPAGLAPVGTTMPPPATADQRRANLIISNQRRAERADMLRKLKAGEITLRQVFEAVDRDGSHGVAGRTRLRHLLTRVPQVGPARADRILAAVELDGDRRLSTLTPAQRDRVICAAVTVTQTRKSVTDC